MLRLVSACAVVLAVAAGCSTVPGPYRVARPFDHGIGSTLGGEPQIERGRPVPVLDAAGNLISLPWKLLFLDWRFDRHAISPEAEQALEEYLGANELDDVKVRLNQYAPGSDWRRLVANRKVHWAWRATLGGLLVLWENVSVGRLTGSWLIGDHYNPYTDTIHVYSDIPAVLLHEGGHARDFALKGKPGLYSLAGLIPGAFFYFEWVASRDAIRWVHHHDPENLERELAMYRTLHPAYGSYAGGFVGGPIGAAAGVVAGHVSAVVYSRIRRGDAEDAPEETTP